MMNLMQGFLDYTQRVQQWVWEQNQSTLCSVGAAVGASIANEGVLHVFGSGHSAIVAHELVHRAGGLVPVSAISDPTQGFAETLPGFGERLVERYDQQYGLRQGEVLIVVSNSGKNHSPIEVALAAQKRGIRIVAVTSLAMSREQESQHPSGKRLFEVADWVLDNGGITGDAVMEIPNSTLRTGPVSTLTGALLLNLLSLSAIDWMVANGYPVPLLQSANTPGGREFNTALSAKYRHRLSRPV
jgi:uncharacterized phosphosugar-binding protein